MIESTDWIYDPKIILDEGKTIFAVGDVHGHVKSLIEITEYIKSNYQNIELISLGDLIDRGPDSIGCLKYALENYDICVPGNHELLLIGTIYSVPYYSNIFFSNGGNWLKVISSEDKLSYKDTLIKRLGNDLYNKFIQNGKLAPTIEYNPMLHYEEGNLLFIHAGINPVRTMDYNSWIYQDVIYNLYDDSPVWIREEFLNHKKEYAVNSKNQKIIVVHGHSFEHYISHLPTEDYPKGNFPPGYTRIDGYRLGLDTGNFHTNILTGAVFENGRYKIVNSIDANENQ